MNATECYLRMCLAIAKHARRRDVKDSTSPRQTAVEAPFCSTFTLHEPLDNAVQCVAFDRRWAIANLLHFFAATEDAAPLRRYNKHADRFLTGDRWVGAYGAIAVPQLERCVALLREDQATRRAVVCMGGLPQHRTINSPPCWNLLHFQADEGWLDAAVYQRSLSMRVMPYDAVVLSNALNYVARSCSLLPRCLHWTVGNLHTDGSVAGEGVEQVPLLLPIQVLANPADCWDYLNREHLWTGL